MKKMKKFKKISSFWKVEKLQEALEEQNIAKALDMIEVIKEDKYPELPKNILNSLENRLLFLLNNLTMDSKKIAKHFHILGKIIQEIVIENPSSRLI